MHDLKHLRKNLLTYKKKLKIEILILMKKKFERLDNLNRKLIGDKEKLEQEKKDSLSQKIN